MSILAYNGLKLIVDTLKKHKLKKEKIGKETPLFLRI